jgi:hypothetical protein
MYRKKETSVMPEPIVENDALMNVDVKGKEIIVTSNENGLYRFAMCVKGLLVLTSKEGRSM